MKLSKKTFVYSIMIAVLMVAFVVGYFVFMLPSLYVDYVMKRNLEDVAAVEREYMESRSYANLTIKNPSAVFSLEIPDEGNQIYVAGKFFKVTVEIRDEELKYLLDYLRSRMNGGGKAEDAEYPKEGLQESEALRESAWTDGTDILEMVKEKFAGRELFDENYPIAVQMEWKENPGIYQGEYEKFHRTFDDLFIYEAGISDGNYSYTTYTAMAHDGDAYIVTVYPTLTPKMDEITPVVMGSLPMIIAVVFLLVLVSSRFFSRKIVEPVIRLSKYAESAKFADYSQIEAFETKDEDEIAVLGRVIQELYEKLRSSYLKLEEKNHELEEENIRQEVFLRASSHQLKTPISAALLLTEGMMNEVGKYKNVKEYLPQVKSQLLSMRKIVEDILYLNYHAKNMEKEETKIEQLAEEVVKAYAVQIEAGKLQVSILGDAVILSDREMLKKIMDNLFSNAVGYTPEGEKIEIEINEYMLCMKNYGTVIDKDLLPNVFQPFVSSNETGKGKGLGLYVAAYYSRLLGCRVEIENMENGVCARIIFPQ